MIIKKEHLVVFLCRIQIIKKLQNLIFKLADFITDLAPFISKIQFSADPNLWNFSAHAFQAVLIGQ